MSNIWNFFDKLPNNRNAKCKECGKEVARTDGSTTGMNKHLSAKHFASFKKLKEINETTKKAADPRNVLYMSNNLQVLLPGNTFRLDIQAAKAVIGPGIKIQKEKSDSTQLTFNYVATSSHCGFIRNRQIEENNGSSSSTSWKKGSKNDLFWMHYHQKRYIPAMGDTVVGQVTQKAGEVYKIEIGCAEQAILPWLNFDGATKRNRPNIKVGDLIYAKLIQVIEPELTCVSKEGPVSGGYCVGVLPTGGFVIRLNSNVTYKLKSKNFPLLKMIGKEVPFEICIGDNGWIWLKAHRIKETIGISRMIENCEYLTKDDLQVYVTKFINQMKGFDPME